MTILKGALEERNGSHVDYGLNRRVAGNTGALRTKKEQPINQLVNRKGKTTQGKKVG